MTDDGNKIKVEIKTTPVLLDKNTEFSNERYVLGYFVMDYHFSDDAKLTIYYRRDANMEFEALEDITISKDERRISLKLPLKIGSVIDYYVKLTGEFEEYIITSMKLLVKILTVGGRYG